jgi:large subunit ribosomal protein L18
MKGKNANRLRRARRGRAKMSELGMHRLVVHRTPMHIYAQVISPSGDQVISAASTLEAEIKKDLGHTGNVAAARAIGAMIAERAKAAGIAKVAFDRSGYKYHGRIKALADAAREGGLEF